MKNLIGGKLRGEMMSVDLFSKIKASYNSFSKTEKKVADYILNYQDKVIYMSITDLADASGVGESSVFRFCKSIDLKGYQELKIKLAHRVELNNKTPQLSNEISIQDSTEELARKLLISNQEALKETYNLLKEEDIAKTTELFKNANRIYFFGVGSSLITAMEARSKFMRITNKTECSMDSHLQAMSASLMTEQDIGVFISYSGSTKDTIASAEAAHERGAKIIAITRFMKSPLSNYADITLLTGANEGPLQGGSLSVKLSQLFLLDLLYSEYFKITHEASAQNKDLTAKVVVDKLV